MGLFSKSDKKDKNKPEKEKKSTSDILKKSRTLFIIASVCAIVALGGTVALLTQTISQTSYYVLNQNVPARAQISDDMLTEVRTTQGGEPRNALDLGDLTNGDAYSKYALQEGDVLSGSNVGPLTPVNEGIPEDFVTMSFTVPAENAVAGNVKRGDYIDFIAKSGTAEDSSAQARYALRHVLVVDVRSTPTTINDVEEDGSTEGSGVASLYTITVSEKDAATVALLQGSDYYIVLSPAVGSEEAKDIRSTGDDVFGNEPVGNSGEGTSPSFNEDSDAGTQQQPTQDAETGDIADDSSPEETLPEEGTTDTSSSDDMEFPEE